MAPKKVTVTMTDPQEKKAVVRYNNEVDNAALASIYISKDALKIIGNPSSVKITIEAA
jgi:hypothetical protein